MISNIQIDNFKSLKGVNVSFGPTNFIVGPNASGKSNFAEALDFLSHAIREDLAFAVAEKGGFYNICHRRQRRARGGISFAVSCDTHSPDGLRCQFTLTFEIKTRGQDIRADFYIASESLEMHFQQVEGEIKSGALLVINRSASKYELSTPPDAVLQSFFKKQRLVERIIYLRRLLTDAAIPMSQQHIFISGFLGDIWPISIVKRELQGLRVFQLNPRLARQPGAPSVHGELGRRGENLASALDRMRTHDKKNFATLSTWLRDVVPTLSNLLTDYTDSRQLGLFFEESGFASRWYAEDVSDGTIMSVALFFALLDKRHKMIVIEEPETSLHPWILKKFLERCREQSKQCQVMITTHSPLAVAQSSPDELFLVNRQEGVTSIRRAAEVEPDLSVIIRKEFIDLGQYWLSGGLGAVPSVPDVKADDLFGPTETRTPQQ